MPQLLFLFFQTECFDVVDRRAKSAITKRTCKYLSDEGEPGEVRQAHLPPRFIQKRIIIDSSVTEPVRRTVLERLCKYLIFTYISLVAFKLTLTVDAYLSINFINR